MLNRLRCHRCYVGSILELFGISSCESPWLGAQSASHRTMSRIEMATSARVRPMMRATEIQVMTL
jgi:hypothetical protein